MPPYLAEMTGRQVTRKDRVVMLNVAVVDPAGTVTLEVGVAMKLILLLKVTVMPPAGAWPLKVTVPTEEVPPTTLVGFSATCDSATAGVIVSAAVLLTPL